MSQSHRRWQDGPSSDSPVWRSLGAFGRGTASRSSGSDKARGLLAYLAVEAGQAHRREKLAGLLWPDYTESSARASLRRALADLRLAIGDQQASPSFLLIGQETIQFNTQATPPSTSWLHRAPEEQHDRRTHESLDPQSTVLRTRRSRRLSTARPSWRASPSRTARISKSGPCSPASSSTA